MLTPILNSLMAGFMQHPVLYSLIFGGNFGALGLIFLLVFLSNIKADQRCKNWPGAQGKIISCHIKKWDTRRGVRYTPEIKYSYVVDGNTYQGNRIGNSIYIGLTKGGSSHWSKKYRAGTAVTIYYNPAEPNEAVLEKFTLSNIYGFIVALVVSALGIFLLGAAIYFQFFWHQPKG